MYVFHLQNYKNKEYIQTFLFRKNINQASEIPTTKKNPEYNDGFNNSAIHSGQQNEKIFFSKSNSTRCNLYILFKTIDIRIFLYATLNYIYLVFSQQPT